MRIARDVARRRKNIVLMEVSIATNEGMERAKEFDVQATPTIAVNGKIAFVGVPSGDALCTLIVDEERKERERTSYFF
jgi:predicted DsbA family dithiol-disulfide isomerase